MPVTVSIDETTRITSDSHQWIVQTKSARGWDSKSYHPNYRAALLHQGEAMIRGSDAIGLAEALDQIEVVVNKLVDAHKDLVAPKVDDEGFLTVDQMAEETKPAYRLKNYEDLLNYED
jgi:hypothetical protein|tara:strand:+ start:2362 stop:2715 length:354 start_codon:yes stop_codon:yes gene_type:complete